MKIIPKPLKDEYEPYTSMYIDLLPNDNNILFHLRNNLTKTIQFVSSFSEEKLVTPNASGEWTIKEILVHIIDDERIYCYRALRFARNDSTKLPGFEQDEYVPYTLANQRSLKQILEELSTVRNATISFFNSLNDEALTRKGIGSGNVMSVRAAAYHIAGHELHHINSIKENYL